LALEAARMSVASLLKEAHEADDLVVPDLVDGLAYPARALLVCGLLAAYFLSERTFEGIEPSLRGCIQAVLAREVRYVRLAGECDAAPFLVMACALEQVGDIRTAEGMILSLVRTLSKQNQRHSRNALADPYHDTEQVLLQQIGAESSMEGEEFDGRSYMLHVGIEWLARRLWRQHLAMMWPDVTRVQFLEFQPSVPERYLAVEDGEGELKMWFAGQPQSWAALLAQSSGLDRTKIPEILWARRDMMPYLPLMFPYRLTATLSRYSPQSSCSRR
jgi:hypothetical protein